MFWTGLSVFERGNGDVFRRDGVFCCARFGVLRRSRDEEEAMKTASVVIGANFGDEGKGLVTDYLCWKNGKNARGGTETLVVRYNGGAQAGHTVVVPDPGFDGGTEYRRHVFGHFGSGTFAGAGTLLSRFFIVNPVLFEKEWRVLSGKGARPTVFVDMDAPMTTPYDMLVNQMVEQARTARHGSCGVGINETVTRHGKFPVTARDLLDPRGLQTKAEIIRTEYLPQRFAELGFPELAKNPLVRDESMIERLMLGADYMRSRCALVSSVTASHLMRTYKVVFEGAQGLLLDEEHEWFPYVTRSKTGLRNVVQLATEAGIERLDVNYVTRTYLTRHGAGPLPGELERPPYSGIHDDTNVKNSWQGGLRYAHLDGDLLVDSIIKDQAETWGEPEDNSLREVNSRIVLTCIDHTNLVGADYYFQYKLDGLHWLDTAEVAADEISAKAGCSLPPLGSFGPTRDTLRLLSRQKVIKLSAKVEGRRDVEDRHPQVLG
jgi:adenylosuccinate synthase